jgi:hypothetical protein
MSDMIMDLKVCKERKGSIDDIEFIIKNSVDPSGSGRGMRYDVAMCVYEDEPEMWKEIHKLSVKWSCLIQMNNYKEDDDIIKELIACCFQCSHTNLNSVCNAECYHYDVYGLISEYIGEDTFEDIMSHLPHFLKRY